MMRTLVSSVVVALVLVGVSHVAHAQPATDGFRPALDEHGYLTLDASQPLGDHDVSFGIGSLDWGHRVVGSQMPVADAMTATLIGAVGLQLGSIPFELAASAPFTTTTDGQGVGDLGFHIKAQLVDGRRSPIGVSVIGRLYVPTASGPEQMMMGVGSGSDTGDSATPEVGIVIDHNFGRARVALDGGVRWEAGVRELPVGVGGAVSIVPAKLEVVGEVTGTYGLATAQPLEALAGLKLYLAKSSYLSLGAGRSLSTTSPDVRAFIGIVFEPKTDAPLPRVPEPPPPIESRVRESRDPPAADGDDLGDALPSCADDPERAGCLDLSTVVDTGSTLVTLEPINFEFDKAVIAADSHHILDVVAQTLHDNPDIQKIEVQGHTDERGHAAYNLDLSDRRAAAVVDYLVSRGVERSRLASKGYGDTRPVDAAHTDAAWTKNRRVAFVISQRQ